MFVDPDAAVAPTGDRRDVADHVALQVARVRLHRRDLGLHDRSPLVLFGRELEDLGLYGLEPFVMGEREQALEGDGLGLVDDVASVVLDLNLHEKSVAALHGAPPFVGSVV